MYYPFVIFELSPTVGFEPLSSDWESDVLPVTPILISFIKTPY
jgi:hypothetical protein